MRACQGSHCGETVLVVDDDRFVRLAIRSFLERLGYRALEAATGQQVEQLASSGREIDVTLIDVRLPGTSGLEVSARLAQLRPEIRVIYMSASRLTERDEPLALGPKALLLMKPFTEAELAAALRTVLGPG